MHGKEEKKRNDQRERSWIQVENHHAVCGCINQSVRYFDRNFCGYLILRFFQNRKNSQNIVPANNSNIKVGRAGVAEVQDRKQSDSYTDMYACAPLSVSVTTQNGGRLLDVLPAFRRLDRGSKQSSTKLLLPFSGSRTPHRWPPKDRPGPALPQERYSLFILTSELGFERFCSPQE